MNFFEKASAEKAAAQQAKAAKAAQRDASQQEAMARRRAWYDEQRSAYLTPKFQAFVADGQAFGHRVLHTSGDNATGNPCDLLEARVEATRSRYSLYVLADLQSEETKVVLGQWTEMKGDQHIEVPGVSGLNADSIDAGLEALAKHLVNAS